MSGPGDNLLAQLDNRLFRIPRLLKIRVSSRTEYSHQLMEPFTVPGRGQEHVSEVQR